MKQMAITLKVDGAQLSDDVREILDTLTNEQKQTMALELLTQTMQNAECKFSKRVGIDGAIKEMNKRRAERRKSGGHSSNGTFFYHEKDGLKLRDSNRDYMDSSDRAEFDRLTKKYANVNTYFEEEILKEMLQVAVTKVAAAVDESDVLKNAIEAAVNEVQGRVPSMVQGAMQQLFFQNMSTMMITGAFMETERETTKQLLEGIQDRLNRNQIY